VSFLNDECSLPQIILFSTFRLKLYNQIQNPNCNKVKLSEHFIYLILICDVLYVVTLVMTPHNDPGLDWPFLLNGGTSQLVSEHYGCNISCMVLFSKIAVRIRLDVHIRNIVVLTGGKLTVFKLCNYGKCMVWFLGLFWIILLFMKLILLLVNFSRTIRIVYICFIIYAHNFWIVSQIELLG
jgi:hypothetical protein